jgi:ABC-type phosphate/phosphonate transport system ATPase subunit
MSQPWDYIAKLVCIGDSGTGKSSVIKYQSSLVRISTNLEISSLFDSVKVAFPHLTMSLLELNLDHGLCQLVLQLL